MTAIAIIPARGGSKRIIRKNIKLLAGIPAIAYPIKLALNSGLFEKVIVSTDDAEIAEVSIKHGAQIPFMRNATLSNDFTITVDVLADAVEQLLSHGEHYDYVCCIYPVTPLLKGVRLNEAFEIIQSGMWDYVFPAIEFPSPVERGFKRGTSGIVEFINPEFANTRTQDIPKTFHDSGQFYFGTTEAWLKKTPILTGNSTFIELAKNETLDIDDLEDWELVEKLMEIKK